jgi:outer membrane protein assembly factor BamB
MSQFRGHKPFRSQFAIDIADRYSVTGASLLRGFADIDGDGETELILNIGSAADFTAIDSNGSTVWRNTQDATQGKTTYYPQIVESDSCAIYGHRVNDTVYCINLSDGTVRWTYTANGDLEATDQSSAGVVVGSSNTNGEVVLLDYSTGSIKSGWPVSVKQHEQALGTGDLDGDGQDEIVLNDNSGNIEVRNADGKQRFALSSSHSHADLHCIGDIHPTHSGNELLTVVDDDNSESGEGDEFILLDANGNEVARHTLSNGQPVHAVGDIHPDRDGLEVAYSLEGQNEVGLLDGTLSPLWTVTMDSELIGSGSGGQVALADFAGDGDISILTCTSQSPESGTIAFNSSGEYQGRFYGLGWDSDPVSPKPNAAVETKRRGDVDGDGRDEVLLGRVPSDELAMKETLHIVERPL